MFNHSEFELNPGQDVYLQCQGPRDEVITLLEWNRADYNSDDYVFMYRNSRAYESHQHASFRGRVDLMDPTIKDGNVSVVLRNITIHDTGTYICRITIRKTEHVVHQCVINLRVTTSGKFCRGGNWNLWQQEKLETDNLSSECSNLLFPGSWVFSPVSALLFFSQMSRSQMYILQCVRV